MEENKKTIEYGMVTKQDLEAFEKNRNEVDENGFVISEISIENNNMTPYPKATIVYEKQYKNCNHWT